MKGYLATSLLISLKIIKYLLIAAVVAFIFIGLLLLSRYQDLKAATLAGLAGKEEISAAVAALERQDWTAAEEKALQGQQSFTAALDNLNKLHENYFLGHFQPLASQVNDLEYL